MVLLQMIDKPEAMHQNDKIQTTPITNENNQMSKHMTIQLLVVV